MPADFEIESPGSVSVRTPGRGFSRFATPKGIDDLTFRNALATVQILYNELGRFPDIDELEERWPDIPGSTWGKILVTDEAIAALEARGIAFEPKQALSYEQQQALLLLTDPTDRRPTGAKLKQVGVPYSRYQGWMRQPLFADAMLKMSENNLRDAVPMLLNKVVTEAENGKIEAIKLGLAMSGRYDPNAQQVQDARQVVFAVVEAVARHVADPGVRAAIMADVEAAAIGFTLNNPRALEA